MISASYSDISVRMLSICGCQKIKTTFWVGFIFVKSGPTGSVRAPRHIYVPHVNEVYVIGGAHDQHADEQLANLQKRIYLIEFLHLGLIIGCQGAMLPLPYFCQGFFFPPPTNTKHRPFGRWGYFSRAFTTSRICCLNFC